MITLALAPALSHAQCNGFNDSGYLGFFDDGSGGGNYDNNQNCTWTFTSEFDTRVRVGFYEFNSESCCDFLRIYDGPNDSAPLIAELAGNQDGTQFLSTGNVITVVWSTDFSVTSSGFLAYWDAYGDVIEACDESLYVLPAAGFPDAAIFNWFLNPENADVLTFNFSSLNMESGFDYVSVYDGSNTNAPLLGAFTGNSTPTEPLVALSGTMLIQATTDGSVASTGFTGWYHCGYCSGLTTLTASSGSIEDGSEELNHGNYTNCQWLIQPPGAAFVNIDIASMNLESGFDYLTIYDGSNANGTVLATLSGNDSPQALYAASGSAYITFTSDGSVTNQGWELTYNSSTVGVEEDDTAFEVNAFPNPTSGFLQVQLNQAQGERYTLDVFDLQGRNLQLGSGFIFPKNGSTLLDLSGLASGSYLLIIRNEQGFAKQIKVQKAG